MLSAQVQNTLPVAGGIIHASKSLDGALGRLRQTRIRARTLVLQGAEDTVVDPGNGKLLADRIPGAQLMIFPELGHLLFWQDPDGFADVVISFLLAIRGNQPGMRDRRQLISRLRTGRRHGLARGRTARRQWTG